MAYTTINKPSEYFNTKLYTQTGSTNNGDTQTITMDNVGMVWIKNRSYTNAHALFDIIRGGNGANCLLSTNSTTGGQGSDIDSAEGLTFGSSTTTIGTDGGGYGYNNRTGDNYVAWHWRTDGTTGSSNTDGSLSSTVSVNTTSGFSIVRFTGNSTAGATVGHGLGITPDVVIAKPLQRAENWRFYHKNVGANYNINLDGSAGASLNSSIWSNTAPNSTVVTLGENTSPNPPSETCILYCFAEKKGFSKFGSYTGNGNADGTFVYTGFKPAYVLTKRTDGSYIWSITDGVRNPYNPTSLSLQPEYSNAESEWSPLEVDFLSNGFKLRTSSAQKNGSGSPFIYMAFAEQPLVGTNGIPATAR